MAQVSGQVSVHEFSAPDLRGEPVALERYRGQVLLIVNTASACGYTPQYAALEALYRQYQDQGLTVLGFPCNQFGAQEPGDAGQIQEFCQRNYGVSFPMFAKIDVNGTHAHPLFVHLKQQAPGILGTRAIKWNFTKFLVDRSGMRVQRFAPRTDPGKLDTPIRRLLG